MKNVDSRLRRAKRTRMKIRELEAVRLSVNKTPRHMYAQITTSDGSRTLAYASTLDKELRNKLKQFIFNLSYKKPLLHLKNCLLIKSTQ